MPHAEPFVVVSCVTVKAYPSLGCHTCRIVCCGFECYRKRNTIKSLFVGTVHHNRIAYAIYVNIIIIELNQILSLIMM